MPAKRDTVMPAKPDPFTVPHSTFDDRRTLLDNVRRGLAFETFLEGRVIINWIDPKTRKFMTRTLRGAARALWMRRRYELRDTRP